MGSGQSPAKLMCLCWRLERKVSFKTLSLIISQYFCVFYLNLCGLEFSFTPVYTFRFLHFYCLLVTFSHIGAVLTFPTVVASH